MSHALVILQAAAPMSLCSICPKPGACCKGFQLFTTINGMRAEFTVPRSAWRDRAQSFLNLCGLPYTLDGYRETSRTSHSVTPVFRCEHRTHEGRCGIWERRPKVCSDFLPAADPLCIFPREPE